MSEHAQSAGVYVTYNKYIDCGAACSCVLPTSRTATCCSYGCAPQRSNTSFISTMAAHLRAQQHKECKTTKEWRQAWLEGSKIALLYLCIIGIVSFKSNLLIEDRARQGGVYAPLTGQENSSLPEAKLDERKNNAAVSLQLDLRCCSRF